MDWTTEGFALDDAGNLIMTAYIDLRNEEDRLPIPALVKGCKTEYALENGGTILLSKPARFRDFGENLIRDDQEGLAKEEMVAAVEQTPAQAMRQRAIADMNEALELAGGGTSLSSTYKESLVESDRSVKSFKYGKGWWIFCASIEPKDDERGEWRAALDEGYDHESVIGQPSKFAQALARMVVEQIGPQGDDGSMTDKTGGLEKAPTKHKSQFVIHGPVVYRDSVYDYIDDASDEMTRLVRSVFTKSTEYAGQREYRFAVMSGGASQESVILQISGMMRDALNRTTHGLVRDVPVPAKTVDESNAEPSARPAQTSKLLSQQATVTRQRRQWEERRRTTTQGGKVTSSDSERVDTIDETSVLQVERPLGKDSLNDLLSNENDGGELEEQPVRQPKQGSTEQDWAQSDDEAARELALAELDWNGERQAREDGNLVVHSGSGRAYKSIEEMANDPTCPMGSSGASWKEEACTPDEIVQTFGWVEALTAKLMVIEEECRQDVASAGWYALNCIRGLYAKLGDVVDVLWVERNRFVVIRLKESEDLKATGRIVVSPSGGYAYCLQLQKGDVILGYGGIPWGTMFFPMGREVDNFETYGWPGKTN